MSTVTSQSAYLLVNSSAPTNAGECPTRLSSPNFSIFPPAANFRHSFSSGHFFGQSGCVGSGAPDRNRRLERAAFRARAYNGVSTIDYQGVRPKAVRRRLLKLYSPLDGDLRDRRRAGLLR